MPPQGRIDYAALAEEARRQAAQRVDYAALAEEARREAASAKKVATEPPIDNWSEGWQAAKDLVKVPWEMIKAGAQFGYDKNPAPLIATGAKLIQGMRDARQEQLQKGQDATKDYVRTGRLVDLARAGGHTLAGAVPVVGPMVAQNVEDVATGHYGRAAVNTAVLAAPSVLGKAGRMVSGVRLGVNASPAVEFGMRAGIPVDAGTATGNMAVRAIQHLSDRTIGGSVVAKRALQEQGAALESTGRQLAARGSQAGPVSAEAAGAETLQNLDDLVATHHKAADVAYDQLRALEKASPQQVLATKPGGTGLRALRLAVDLDPVKASLRPIYDGLQREWKIGGGLKGAKAQAMNALERLLEGPRYESLSVVDSALGDLKAAARGADLPQLRTQGQGIAAKAVDKLSRAVEATARAGGQDVVDALEAGRAATRAKYAAADVWERVGGAGTGEPVGVFKRLIATDDKAINLLRDLKAQTPQTLQSIGRAAIDELIDKATAKGGFKNARTIASDWNRIGDATKRLLYPDPQHLADLNHFFRLAEDIAENPNPSGTAHVGMMGAQVAGFPFAPISTLLTQLGGAAVSKLLHSPATARALVNGLTMPNLGPALQGASRASLMPGIVQGVGTRANENELKRAATLRLLNQNK